MRYQISSKARQEAGSGICDENILPGFRAAGVPGLRPGSVDDSLREHGEPADGASHAF